MKEIIKKMIDHADKTHDYEVAEMVWELLSELARTYNAPSNWRDIGEELAEEYNGSDWLFENCKLWDFI